MPETLIHRHLLDGPLSGQAQRVKPAVPVHQESEDFRLLSWLCGPQITSWQAPLLWAAHHLSWGL